MRVGAFVLMMLSIVEANKTFREAKLFFKKGGYENLPKELREYLESTAEQDTATNKHIKNNFY